MSLIFCNLVVSKNIKFKSSYVQPLYKGLSKYLRYASNSLKILSMNLGNVPHRVLFLSFQTWKWWHYP